MVVVDIQLLQRAGESRQHVLPECYHAVCAGLSAVFEVSCFVLGCCLCSLWWAQCVCSLLVEISTACPPTTTMLASTSTFKAWRHMVAFMREFEEPTLAQCASSIVFLYV